MLSRSSLAFFLAFACCCVPCGGLRLSAAPTASPLPDPVVGLCIAAPSPQQLDSFVRFIDEELGPAGVNVLTLRIDYNFEYTSHPELRGANPLSLKHAEALANACRRQGIELIPQVNLLGHQSWAENLGNLLRVYPQFDETPHVAMPETYSWPNADGLYCKSYCPLHPEVHDIVFALIDEVMNAFGARAFHAGMDEVFYIADDKCPRCAGKDPAALFAGEVTRIRDHLARNGRELWIWGDRLIDGKTTGIGLWEASENGTHPAINLIPKDVVVCDWHYERAEPTAALFALKGLRVVSCPWNKPAVAVAQARDFHRLRENANATLAARHLGMMQTVWTDAGRFLDAYYGAENARPDDLATANCFRATIDAMKPQRKPTDE